MILITGATGTVGTEIVKALRERTPHLRVLARNPVKAAELLGDDIEIARGDFTDPASLEAAMENVDHALLLSAPDPRQVEHQSNFIGAAKSAGVEHIVKLSSAGADPKSAVNFLRWHGQSEAELKASGIGWTMLRPTFFMQNLLTMAGMIREGTIYMPTGDGRAPFVDVRDIAAVAAVALTKPGHMGKVYEITGPQSLSYAEVAAVLTKVLGRPVKHVDVSPEAAKQSMMQAGLPEWQAESVNQLSEAMKRGLFDHVSTAVRDLTGRDARPLDQFISDNRAAFA